MLSLTKSTCPWCASASCSRIGWTARQGPHHGAQKSTTTGRFEASTCSSNRTSVTSSTGSMLQTTPQRGDAEQRDLPDRLEHDRAAHLRAAGFAVDEPDRNLDDAEARPQRAVGRLDLERVAAAADPVEVDPLAHRAAVALEAPGQCADPRADNDLGVDRATAG